MEIHRVSIIVLFVLILLRNLNYFLLKNLNIIKSVMVKKIVDNVYIHFIFSRLG